MSSKRIDLTPFEKITHEIHSLNVIINGEETTEYQRYDLWDTWILNEQQAAEGKALLVFTTHTQNPVCSIKGYETAEEGMANANAIAHVPKLIAELKRMYKREDLLMKAFMMAGNFGCYMTICEECDDVHTLDDECPFICEYCGDKNCEHPDCK